MKTYNLLATDIETSTSDSVSVYEKHGFNNREFYLQYLTVDNTTNEKRHYAATVNPETLTYDQRREILDYCLGEKMYDKDEIVNYLDLFMHSGYIKES